MNEQEEKRRSDWESLRIRQQTVEEKLGEGKADRNARRLFGQLRY